MGRPRRTKVPGYTRGQTPHALRTEFEKLERAQANTDTVAISENYEITVQDRTILVDTTAGNVSVTLKPARTRFALPVSIVKISDDENEVHVLPATGETIGVASELQWKTPYVAYSMHPDGIAQWWLEGFHEEVTEITPGAFPKVVVNRRGRVVSSEPLAYTDIPPLPYDPVGAAQNAELRSRAYTDEQVAAVPAATSDAPMLYEPAGAANRAVSDARRYTDAAIAAIPPSTGGDPVMLYDPAGAADRAVADARRYTDAQIAGVSSGGFDGLIAGFLFLTP